MTLSRRTFLKAAAIAAPAAALSNAAFAQQQQARIGEGGQSLMRALALRRSTRAYAETVPDPDTINVLLWAAFGINRPASNGHTAPSWRGSNGTDIYVADAQGVTLYDPLGQKRDKVMDGDIRGKASQEPFVKTAPVILIYVADLERMAEASDEDRRLYSYVDAAIIAENVYLFCASEGLATCLVGGADREALKAIFNLPDNKPVIYVQPVGYPQA